MPTIERKILLPRLPNFLRIEGQEETVNVSELSDNQIKALGQEWAAALIEHARNRRQNQEGK